MAAYSRSPPLALLFCFLCLWSSVSVIGQKLTNDPALPPDVRAVDPLGKNAPVAAGASQLRRVSGWKLAEEEACREDLTRLCPKQTWTNNLAVLECLQDRREIKECNEEERGRGYLVSCLVDHRGNISEYQCNQYITKITSIIFSDYRLICGFMDKCREDINNLRCGSINIGQKDAHSQGEVIACLEKALVRQAEQQDRVHPIREECQKAILRVAELSSDDFHLDRHLYFACRDDRERFCQSDYRVSYSLAKACKLDLRKQRCSLDTSLPRAREARLSYLLLCLEAAVHRGRPVSGECQGEMLDFRRMLMEDFSLSPEIVLHCRSEIEAQCSGLHRKGRTLHCLMRLGRGDRNGAVDSICQSALQTLIQSADPGADYRIDRALNEACESVIQTACKHIRSGDPMILSCLMEHLYTEKMVEDCEHRLLELQYFISRDWK
ncbi:glycogenin glucosyltransferase glg1 [Goodea atripinnis]|uniref:Golgi apparatus protein 1 n=1 Tax=Goodea atripinnis TaxID=208336 RepID=A0ABV0MNJ1_9TELE